MIPKIYQLAAINMEINDQYKYMKWCNENYIFINPVPVDNFETYKIEVLKRGDPKIGNDVYRKSKGKEHPVFKRIRELYKQYYELGQKQKVA